jgi:hypothetical protein
VSRCPNCGTAIPDERIVDRVTRVHHVEGGFSGASVSVDGGTDVDLEQLADVPLRRGVRTASFLF